MEQQRGKGGPAGTGDVDHAVAEVLLSPALTCHPFDAFRVLAFRMLLAASSPLFSCSSCGFDCVQEGVSKCDALASVVAAGHAFERFTRRGGSFFGALTEEEDGQASVRVSGFSVPCDWRLKSPAGSTVDTELQQEKSMLEIVGLRILADK
ncbi:unnamed protein product [Sphagnum jensenii]